MTKPASVGQEGIVAGRGLPSHVRLPDPPQASVPSRLAVEPGGLYGPYKPVWRGDAEAPGRILQTRLQQPA